jgi:tetratricopeptide (TPR) repeat protein
MATGAKQRRGYQSVSQASNEGRSYGGRVMSNEEEMNLTQEWMRVRAHGDYEAGVSMAMLFDTMAAHLMAIMLKLMSAGGDEGGNTNRPILSEAQREKKKRDLINESTWYLQQGEAVEKQKFPGQSSQWYHHLMVGLQYFCKKDDSKATAEFKLSLSLFESRAARIGLSLVLIRSLKYVEALEELSRVYTSIYASYNEKVGEKQIDGLESTQDQQRSRSGGHNYDSNNPISDFEWFKTHASEVRTNGERNAQIELLTTYSCLRPLMAMVWAKIGAIQRSIDVLKLQVASVDEGMSKGWIYSLPANHDRTLSMLGILQVNKHNDMMLKARTIHDQEEAASAVRESIANLTKAFQLNPNNPNVLNHMSNIFFVHKSQEQRDWDRIDGLAQRAKELAQAAGLKEICAESCYYLGRSSHARGKYGAARQHYMDSLYFSNQFPLPRYALAQLSFHDQDYTAAIEHLSKLDSKVPDLSDTKAFLGKIHLKLTLNPSSPSEYQTHYTNASKLLTRAIQLNPSLISTHMDLAQLKERTSPLESLSSYLLASDLCHSQFISQSSLDVDAYKNLSSEMFDAANAILKDGENSKISLYPGFLKRFNLLAPRTVYNNVAVMRISNGLLEEAKDALLRTILMGACTLGATNPSSSKSSSSSNPSFVNPMTYATEIDLKTPETNLVFVALFGRSLRDLLAPHFLASIESFILKSGVITLPLNITTSYNLGLCYEKMKDFSNAIAVFSAILNKYPDYLDAKLRLAMVKRENGQLDDAEKLLKEVMAQKDDFASSSHSSSSDVNAKARMSQQELHRSNIKAMAGIMLANILVTKKEYKETQAMMDALVNKLSSQSSSSSSNSNSSGGRSALGVSNDSSLASSQWTFGSDSYALVQYANFFLHTSYFSPNRDKNLKWATGLFSTVLKQTPGNIYAANGLAIINALHAKDEISSQMEVDKKESEKLKDSNFQISTTTKWSEKSRNAMNAFLAIREACPNMADIVINLGHLSFAVGDYRGAAKHYQTAWTKLGSNNQLIKMGQVTPMLARCLYEMGQFDQAKNLMESVLSISSSSSSSSSMDIDEPSYDEKDEDLWYNLAVMCKEWSMQILNRVDSSLSHVTGGKSYRNDGNDDVENLENNMDEDVDTTATQRKNANVSSQEIRFVSAPSEEEQKKAIDMLVFARPIFERLAKINSDSSHKIKKISFSTKKCSILAKLCENNADLAQEKLETYRREMEKENEMREMLRKKVEEEEALLQAQLLEEEANLKKKLEEENDIAEALRLKSQQMMEEFVSGGGDENDTKRSSSKRGRTQAMPRVSYNNTSEEQDEANERIARSRSSTTRKGRQTRRIASLGGGDDDDDDNDGNGASASSDDEYDGGKGGDDEFRSSTTRSSLRYGEAPSEEGNGDVDADESNNHDNQRRSQLEELAQRRNAGKRGHGEISAENIASSSSITSAATTVVGKKNVASSSDALETSIPSQKKRKLKDNRDKTNDANDDVELPDDMDF